ncbi:hypothetical protein [Angustibacter aerolatus]
MATTHLELEPWDGLDQAGLHRMQQAVDDVARSHAGQDEPVVSLELRARLRDREVPSPSGEVIDQVVTALSAGDTVRLTLR